LSSFGGVREEWKVVGNCSSGVYCIRPGLQLETNAPLDDVDLKATASMLQIPESAGPVCITYNLPSLKPAVKAYARSPGRNFSWHH
jgi:hypothetical protein